MKKRPQRGLLRWWGLLLAEAERLDVYPWTDPTRTAIWLEAPQGTVFKATGSHSLHEPLQPNARDAYKVLVRQLASGLEPCRGMECGICGTKEPSNG